MGCCPQPLPAACFCEEPFSYWVTCLCVESCSYKHLPKLPAGSRWGRKRTLGEMEACTRLPCLPGLTDFCCDFGFSLSCVSCHGIWRGWWGLPAALQWLAQSCTVARKGGSASLDYLYPPFMQSQVCGWEAGSFGIKNPPRANALRLLHWLPNSCHV